MEEDKYIEAMIELNGLLEEIKEKGILTKEDVIREVENIFEE